MHLFSDEYLIDLFSKCGFTLDEICVHNKQVENHLLNLVMNRWFIWPALLICLLYIFTMKLQRNELPVFFTPNIIISVKFSK